jgi:holo-[acyl-carrier protein] synthase
VQYRDHRSREYSIVALRVRRGAERQLLLVTILIGADIQEIDEVRESIETYGDRYVRRVYTDYEIDDCCKNAKGAASALASRFAAKEAVFKILTESDVVATWQDIEVRRLESGQPVVALRGAAATLAARQGITTMSLSLSQNGAMATAVVVAESATGADR